MNPARAELFDLKNGSLNDLGWSSYPYYLKASKRPVWLSVVRVLNCHDVDYTRKGSSWYRQYMQQRVEEIAGSKNPYVVKDKKSKVLNQLVKHLLKCED